MALPVGSGLAPALPSFVCGLLPHEFVVLPRESPGPTTPRWIDAPSWPGHDDEALRHRARSSAIGDSRYR